MRDTTAADAGLFSRTVAALRLLRSTVGLKAIMAATGGAWLVFLTLHLYSNLHIFLGAAATNGYYADLKHSYFQLWSVRATLLGAMVLHVVVAFKLARLSMGARQGAYARSKTLATDYAARTMRITGPLLLLYIIGHLLHLTLGVVMPGEMLHDPADVYGNIVGSFRNPGVAGVYIAASLLLGLHIFHGTRSLFQSLGLKPAAAPWLPSALAVGVSGLLVFGQVAMVVGSVSGWLAL